jgi:hypothetical protein
MNDTNRIIFLKDYLTNSLVVLIQVFSLIFIFELSGIKLRDPVFLPVYLVSDLLFLQWILVYIIQGYFSYSSKWSIMWLERMSQYTGKLKK